MAGFPLTASKPEMISNILVNNADQPLQASSSYQKAASGVVRLGVAGGGMAYTASPKT